MGTAGPPPPYWASCLSEQTLSMSPQHQFSDHHGGPRQTCFHQRTGLLSARSKSPRYFTHQAYASVLL
ncbi:hypothetical protein RRG08_039375 [Elysia crispata]|uniref:Uncharacterized protein n=1 Tax=Elysia crispata TaxID=231223 RepID=A0AAE1CNA7_9GAST|nr:hypothetical protein RRG08_039375 [Elysia crispata]